MKTIPLTRGLSAIVDDEDYDRLIQWEWFACKGRKSWYAKRKEYLGGKLYLARGVSMHREVLRLSYGDNKEVDHRNNNGLDNQRHNLRICTSSQNKMNIGIRKDNRSGFKGVSYTKATGSWCARIKVDGKTIALGSFGNPRQASKAYQKAAVKYHGEFARME